MALTEDAKKELAEAIRIVREDRFEKFAREHIGKARASENTPPKVDGPDAPPPKVDPPEGEDDSPKPRKSAYWGELFDE